MNSSSLTSSVQFKLENITFRIPNLKKKFREFILIYIISNFHVQLKTSAKSTNMEKLKIIFSLAPLFFGS
jgi:hypothetical protein